MCSLSLTHTYTDTHTGSFREETVQLNSSQTPFSNEKNTAKLERVRELKLQ